MIEEVVESKHFGKIIGNGCVEGRSAWSSPSERKQGSMRSIAKRVSADIVNRQLARIAWLIPCLSSGAVRARSKSLGVARCLFSATCEEQEVALFSNDEAIDRRIVT